MVVSVEKSNYHPVRVVMVRKRGETTIDITSCKTKQKFEEKTFRFNKSDYPDAEIIDLR